MSSVACHRSDHHVTAMCGRVIQSSSPTHYAIVDGMNVRDSRVRAYRFGRPKRGTGLQNKIGQRAYQPYAPPGRARAILLRV